MRTIFCDRRDMPKSLFPYIWKVNGVFSIEIDGKTISKEMALSIVISEDEANMIKSSSIYAKQFTNALREELSDTATVIFTIENRISEKIVKQINGEEPVNQKESEEN